MKSDKKMHTQPPKLLLFLLLLFYICSSHCINYYSDTDDDDDDDDAHASYFSKLFHSHIFRIRARANDLPY